MSRIFISHSSKDREQARRLLDWLTAQGLALEAFLDFDEERGIGPGEDWERTLYDEISACDVVIIILSKNSFASKWCFVEYAQARALGKFIIPIITETPEGEVWVSSAIQFVDLVQDRETGLKRLYNQLTHIMLSSHTSFGWEPARPPYPGLIAFEEADAAVYCGRDDDIDHLIQRLTQRRVHGEKLIVVLGASGSGKSSLVRAGVLPRLKRNPHDWIVLPPFRPHLQPIDELAQAISLGLQKPDQWSKWRSAIESDDLFHTLSDLSRDLRAAQAQNEAQILLTVDQGEDIFGTFQKANVTQAARFFTALNALLDERLPFLVLMTLRSDYLDRLQRTPQLTAPFDQFSLRPMPIDRVRAIIEGPAKVARLKVDEELVTEARTEAKTDDALPLLAFTLRELYDRSRSGGHLTIEAYRALGDAQAKLSPLENAVRRKAEEVLRAARPTPDDLLALKQAFIPHMVRVDPKGAYVSQPANRTDLPAAALPLIERLAEARLLIIRNQDNVTFVEVAHEALLRNWPLLRSWLEEQLEFLIGKNQLEQDLRDYQQAQGKQRTEALLWGVKLARGQQWLSAHASQLKPPEIDFIKASVAHAAAKRRAGMLRVTGTLIVVVCLILGSVIVYQIKKKQAALAAEASALGFSASEMERNQPVSLAFLADAMRLDPKNQSAIALIIAELRDAVLPINTLPAVQSEKVGEMEDAEFSPDGAQVVTASTDGAARIWDPKTGALFKTLAQAGRVHTAEFDRTGSLIVTPSFDGTVAVWDAHTGSQLYLLPSHGNPPAKVYTAHFDRDAKSIVASYSDGAVVVWDTATHQQAGMFTSNGVVWDTVFDPNAYRHVVSASEDKYHGVQVWDPSAPKGKAVLLPQGNGNADAAPVAAVAFSSDGKWIAAGAASGKAWVWDAHSRRPVCSGPLQHSDGVNSVNFNPIPNPNPNSTTYPSLVTASRDGTARTWNLPSCRPVGEPMHHAGWVRTAVFSADGRWILTASYDRTAHVWNASNGAPISAPMHHRGAIYAAHFDPNDPHVVATASLDHTSRIWHWFERRSLPSLTGQGVLEQACWDRSATRIVTVSNSATQIWDTTVSPPASRNLSVGAASAAACSSDGQWLITVSGNVARVWNIAAAQPAGGPIDLSTAAPDAMLGASLRLDPGTGFGKLPRWFALIAARGVWLFDIKTGAALLPAPIRMKDIAGAIFSPDGNRIAVYTEEGGVSVWSVSEGKPIENAPMMHARGIISAAFSPDGKRLITASVDRTARVWNVATGAKVAELPLGHWGTDVAFSPYGNWIVTTSADFTAQVWDARTYKPSGPLLRQAAGITHAEFSSDERWVLTFAADGTAQAWGASNGVPVTKPMKGLLPDPQQLSGAHFSSDGNWIVAFASQAPSAGNAGRWQLEIEEAPITGSLAPDWLITLAEGTGGLTVNANGGIEMTSASEDPAQLRREMQALPASDPVSRFGRWLASNPETRPTSPMTAQ